MKKALFVAFASAIALGSCTNNEIDSTTGGTHGLIPINISTYVPRETRMASSTDIWNLVNEGFTFAAMNDASGRSHIGSTTFKVIDTDTGECAEEDGTQFFWPGDSAVSFYAVYPTASDDEASGRTWLYAANDSLVFTPDSYEDILAAYASGKASTTDGNVQLTFKHVSAKVALAACCDNADYNYVLTSVKLTVPSMASYKFSTQKISVVPGVDSLVYDAVLPYFGALSETAVGFDTAFFAADGTAGSTCRLDVSYKITITIGGSEIERTYTKSATVNIIAGYENTVSMKLAGDTPLSINVVANGWTDEGIDANDHGYVDLGLPSGTLWATCNVGASEPEEYGDYFAWAETEIHYTVSDADTTWLTGYSSGYSWTGYKYCQGSNSTMTKYCDNVSYGTVADNKLVLEAEDDAATANWGGSWRMPTKAEWQELNDNTTSEWITQNGIDGRIFTAPNGNSIFLPAAGYRFTTSLLWEGTSGYYWSSSLQENRPYRAMLMLFDAEEVDPGNSMSRYDGLSIRPVMSHESHNADF
ncbi:MAG: hypothetical protein E7070_11690 [Bacteroidales bacterium]|jgi:hypothetical protein|nr:hypothetical protein [Bacteroidales bacterium]